ncbi:hypothetical protein C2S52_020587 [Perilla frutescens var. hirtella]|nr:hypothetical protein C2S52_020587 [Perilla frutescens var. hirtella]
MLWIFLLLLLLVLPNSNNAVSHSFNKLQLPVGSESYAFDSHHLGPYTGLNDGRIVKYQGPAAADKGFLDFATTSPNRSKELCDGTNGDDPKTGPLCGRPIALEFHPKTGDLYIVDAFRGLMLVGRGGGKAERLPGGRDGVPYDAPDAISIDPLTGDVYFTDIGTIFFKTT